MTVWEKRLLLAVIAAAAIYGRLWYPQGAGVVRQWMTGPEDNRVAAAFASLDRRMEQGFGEAAPVFWAERYGLP